MWNIDWLWTCIANTWETAPHETRLSDRATWNLLRLHYMISPCKATRLHYLRDCAESKYTWKCSDVTVRQVASALKMLFKHGFIERQTCSTCQPHHTHGLTIPASHLHATVLSRARSPKYERRPKGIQPDSVWSTWYQLGSTSSTLAWDCQKRTFILEGIAVYSIVDSDMTEVLDPAL